MSLTTQNFMQKADDLAGKVADGSKNTGLVNRTPQGPKELQANTVPTPDASYLNNFGTGKAGTEADRAPAADANR